MTDRAFHPRRLDTLAFAKAGAALSGDWPLQDLPRLWASLDHSPNHSLEHSATVPVRAASPVQAPDGTMQPLHWQAQGSMRRMAGAGARPALHLRMAATVTLQCQRCLAPMHTLLEVDRWFCFVADDAEAERLDEDSEDDVLTASTRFDLRTLIEDELLLALPLVPRHVQCPQPLAALAALDARRGDRDVRAHPAAHDDQIEAPHPFAALAALRRGPLS